jgi:hypothetical protein
MRFGDHGQKIAHDRAEHLVLREDTDNGRWEGVSFADPRKLDGGRPARPPLLDEQMDDQLLGRLSRSASICSTRTGCRRG